MSVFLYKFFHTKTNERSEKGLVYIPEDMNDWPDRWKIVEYKTYKIFKPIQLLKKVGPFWNLLQGRRTRGILLADNNVSLEKLSYILRCAGGLQENRGEHRTAPSAGQRYPLELYVFLFKDIEGLSSGVYHYGVQLHALEPVYIAPMHSGDIDKLLPPRFIHEPHGMLCVTAVFNRITEKYGSRGYRHLLLEAGHVAQNALLAGVEEGINFVPVGGCDESAIEAHLGLNSDQEGVVYTLFF